MIAFNCNCVYAFSSQDYWQMSITLFCTEWNLANLYNLLGMEVKRKLGESRIKL